MDPNATPANQAQMDWENQMRREQALEDATRWLREERIARFNDR